MYKSLISALFLGSLVFFANPASAQIIGYYRIKELKESMPTTVIIDSRPEKEFDGNMLPGAKHLPEDEMTEQKLLALTNNSKSTPIIFYCSSHNSPYSAKALLKAKSRGFYNVFRYKGGIIDYQNKLKAKNNNPTIVGNNPNPPRTLPYPAR